MRRVRSSAANPTPKLTSIIAGMATGADSIDDLEVIRAGGMKHLFSDVCASATLGIFLRERRPQLGDQGAITRKDANPHSAAFLISVKIFETIYLKY